MLPAVVVIQVMLRFVTIRNSLAKRLRLEHIGLAVKILLGQLTSSCPMEGFMTDEYLLDYRLKVPPSTVELAEISIFACKDWGADFKTINAFVGVMADNRGEA